MCTNRCRVAFNTSIGPRCRKWRLTTYLSVRKQPSWHGWYSTVLCCLLGSSRSSRTFLYLGPYATSWKVIKTVSSQTFCGLHYWLSSTSIEVKGIKRCVWVNVIPRSFWVMTSTLGSSTEAIIDLLMQYAINRVLLTSWVESLTIYWLNSLTYKRWPERLWSRN